MRLKITTVGLSILLAVLTASCGVGGPSGVLQIVPEGEYFAFVGFNPARFFESRAFEKMMEPMGGTVDYFKTFERQWGGSSIELEELDALLLVASEEWEEMIAFFGGAGIDTDDLVEFYEEEWDAEIEEQDINGVKCWIDEDSESGFTMIENGVLIVHQDTLEDCVGVMKEGKKKLADDADFRDAMSLVDMSSTFYGAIWDNLSVGMFPIAFAIRGVTEDEEEAEEVEEALEELKAAGFSIWFADGFRVVGKARFKDDKSAETIADFLNNALDQAVDKIIDNAQAIASETAPYLDAEKAKTIVERINVSRSGAVVEVSLAIDDIDWLTEMSEASLNRIHQEKTIESLKSLTVAIETYIIDMNFSPKATDIDELVNLLEPFYLPRSGEFSRDDWGNALIYTYDPEPGARSYTIMSYGSDGAVGPEVAPDERGRRIVTKPEEDIIWSDGMQVQGPPIR